MGTAVPISLSGDESVWFGAGEHEAWVGGDATQWCTGTVENSAASKLASDWGENTLVDFNPLDDPFLKLVDNSSSYGTGLTSIITTSEIPATEFGENALLVQRPHPSTPRNILAYASLGEGRAGVLVCTLCHTAPEGPAWNKIRKHWRHRNHQTSLPEVTQEERALAKETWERHSANIIGSGAQWNPPDHPIKPIEHVQVVAAYQCEHIDCSVRYVKASTTPGRSEDSAWRGHQRCEHGVVEFEAVGRPAVSSALASRADNTIQGKQVTKPCGPQVQVQRLFRGRPYHRVLITTGEAGDEQGEGDEATHSTTTWLQQFDELAAVTRGEDAEHLRHIAGPPLHGSNRWAQNAGFSTRLQGFQWTAARRICDKPQSNDEGEAVATAVWHLAGTAMRKSHATAQKAGGYLRELVGRIHPDMSPPKPWTAYTTEKSVADHARTIQACLGFFARTQTDPSAASAVPRYQVDTQVDQAWTALYQYLQSPDYRPATITQGRLLPLTPAERLTLKLLVALLHQEGSLNEAEELPLIVALTVLGIVPGKDRFCQAGEYSHILAGFDKMARCAVLTHGQDIDINGKAWKELVHACLTRGPNHTMNWVGRSKAYARAVDRSNPRPGRLTWIAETETFLYKEYSLALPQLRAIVHGALTEHRRILCEQLLFVQSLDDLPPIPWDQLVDRLDHQPRGSCWTDPANEVALRPGVNWLRDHVDQTQHARFLDRSRHRIQERAIQEFGQSMQQFAEEGMPLAVWAIGMPIRGTTVTTYRWRNSDSGDELRNLVIQNGRLTLVGGHTKAQWAGADAPMHVLPAEVAELWAWYVWLVMPFWNTIRRHIGEAHAVADASFLFPTPAGHAQKSSEWVSASLKRSSARVVAGGLTLQPARQLIAGFTRRFIPADVLQGGTSSQLDTRPQRNAGRAVMSSVDARRHPPAAGFGRGDGDNDYGDAEDRCENDDNEDDRPSEMNPEDVGAGAAQIAGGRDAFAKIRQMMASRSAIEIQTGHSTRMGYAMYGGDVQAIPGIDELQLALWSTVSDYWHLVLRFPSALAREPGSQGRKRTRLACTDEEDEQWHGEKEDENNDDDEYQRDEDEDIGVKEFRDGVEEEADKDKDKKEEDEDEDKDEDEDEDKDEDEDEDKDEDEDRKREGYGDKDSAPPYQTTPVCRGNPRKRRATAATIQQVGYNRQPSHITTKHEALCSLRALLQKPKAEFRGNQWPVLDAILNQHHESLVVIEPTGCGKTVLFMLPAARIGARTTIVVAPFIVLRNQLVQECRRAGVACAVWEGDADPNIGLYLYAKIIVVSAEHLDQPRFKRLTNTLQAARQLERIVIDEAHLPLVAGHWREALQRYDILATLGVPLVMLSATLPVALEARLFAGMRIDPAYARVIRSSTVRPNISYAVVDLGKAAPMGTGDIFGPKGIASFVQQRLQAFPPGARKAMVFVNSRDLVRRLVDLVPHALAFYHDAPDGQRVLEQFSVAVDIIMFCTSAADHGFDIVGVSLVVHASIPHSIICYLQGAGRAGRRGKRAEAILLVGLGIRRFRAETPQEIEDRQVLAEYAQEGVALNVARCRRSFIDEYMDGDRTRQHCRSSQGEQLCDVCAYQQREKDASVVDLPGLDDPQEAGDYRTTACVVPYTPPPPYAKIESRADSRQQIRAHCAHSNNDRLSSSHLSRVADWDVPTPDTSSPQAASSSPCTLAAGGGARYITQQPEHALLNVNRRLECMSWRALWGSDGAARPAPLDRIRSTLLFWKFNCNAHLLHGGEYRHTVGDCDQLPDVHQQIKTASRPWNTKATFTMAPYTGCMSCKVPLGLCCGRGRCTNEWIHVIVDAWATCLLFPLSSTWCTSKLQKLGLTNTEDAAARQYLGQKIYVSNRPAGRIETMPLIDMLVEMTELFFLPQPARLGPLKTYNTWEMRS